MSHRDASVAKINCLDLKKYLTLYRSACTLLHMEHKEFLSNIKAGQYIKTGYRETKSVRKVSKVTKTQIVISEWGWGDEPNIDRFRISDGGRLGDSYYYRHYILADAVSDEEAAAYEARIAENARMRKERKRLNEVETWAKAKLVVLFGERIPLENIKVQFNSKDGWKTGEFEIKCEKITEETLVAVLSGVAGEQ